MSAIDWEELAGNLSDQVRPETRSKYFPQNPLRRALIEKFLARVADAVAASPGQSLLDLGCGEGFVDYYLARRFPGLKITGVEPDPRALMVARAINPGCEYILADGRDLPFPEGSFDAVICLEVLEHLRDFQPVIEQARRASAGPCIFSVPGWPWYQGANFLVGKNWARLGEHPDHVVRFTGRRLKKELCAYFAGPVIIRLSFPWLIAACRK